MNNTYNRNANDSIISELNEAVDIRSSKKTIAYKYFRGNLVELERYLENHLYQSSSCLEGINDEISVLWNK